MRPLGRCRFCNAIWITFYAYEILYGLNIYVLFAFGATTFWVEVLSKYVFPDVASAERTDKELGIDHTEWDDESMTMVMKNTPWQAMLWSYLILGVFYFTIYVVIPYIIL
jgi:hypothetical protein